MCGTLGLEKRVVSANIRGYITIRQTITSDTEQNY